MMTMRIINYYVFMWSFFRHFPAEDPSILPPEQQLSLRRSEILPFKYNNLFRSVY